MTLPIQHPFWVEIIVVFAVSAISAALVYARADRIITPEIVASRGLARVRRDSALAGAFLAMVVGIFVSVLYSRWASASPELASRSFLVGGVAVGIVFSLLAMVLTAKKRMRGAREVIVLNFIWALAYGYLLPNAVIWWAGS